MTMSAFGTIMSILIRVSVLNSLVVVYYAVFAHLYIHLPVFPKRIALCAGINAVVHLVEEPIVGSSFWTVPITAVTMFTVSYILWRPIRGIRFWSCFIYCVLSEFVFESFVSLLYTRLFPGEMFLAKIGRFQLHVSSVYTLPALFLIFLVLLSIPLLFVFLIRRRRGERHDIKDGRRYLFGLVLLTMLVFGVMTYYVFIITHMINEYFTSERLLAALKISLPTFLVCIMAVILLFFYIWQNLQQYRLYTSNEALRNKNSVYQRVLDDTREFRHNISNLLYGFEGIILAGDVGAIKAYYYDIVKRSTRINNENADAMNRITHPALTALVHRKLELAETQEIPVFLNVDSGFSFDFLPNARLVEVMGNLLDNALEAARKSDAPCILLTMCSTPEYDEILLSNTYARDADLSFLSGQEISSKPSHQATGLASVRKTVAQFPGICFNEYLCGRYIEASLCCYK